MKTSIFPWMLMSSAWSLYLLMLISHLCWKLCEASLCNWISRGLQLYLVAGKWQIQIAPWPRKIYYNSILPEPYLEYILVFSGMEESTAFDSCPSKCAQSMGFVVRVLLFRFQLLQLLPIWSLGKLISFLCCSRLTYRIGIRISSGM